jgi:pyruvate formate lyase activating enzyme
MRSLVGGNMKEAMLYELQKDRRVLCQLCPHKCLIDDGKRGICQVRENREGTLYTLVYGQTMSQNVDAVEKKPLFHFYPGSTAYSIATHGCNFHCQYCTNWQISQMQREQALIIPGRESTPEQIVASAQSAGCQSIAYTYVEPTIFFEYVYDTARLAHAVGLFNIYKTNGFMTNDMLEISQPYLDAANVDLKTFQNKTYQGFGGQLQPVLDTLKRIKTTNIWLEITTVVIPSINDHPAELKEIAAFIANELGVDTPWHIARFFPAYKMNHVPPTPVEALHQAREIGLEAGLHYVYLGNFLERSKQDTFCTNCNRLLIQRHGPRLLSNEVQDNGCPYCGTPLSGVGLTGMHRTETNCFDSENEI